jgi:beta-N-acetylhexosaminidase
MSSIDDAKKNLGELFIIGFSGLELPSDTAVFLSQAQIGGIILFAQNYENPGQLAELTNQIQENRGELPLWISVDHEGGRVQRFRKPFTKIPDAQAVGATHSPKLAFEITEVMAKELKAVGININFSPVADINTNSKNPVIGARAYGSREELVSQMVSAVVRGHLVHGVQPCVKHFPGHGDTSTDSHFALPRVDTPMEVLKEREFRPFSKAFRSHCSMVMTAHVLLSKIDPKLPATLSPKIIQDILRNDLRFTGLIISDDMEMKAITDHFGAEDSPRFAIQAGCDLLIYRSEAGARHAYASLVKALEDGKLSPELVLQAAGRSKSLKRKVLLPYHPITIAELGKKVGLQESLEIIQKVEAIG